MSAIYRDRTRPVRRVASLNLLLASFALVPLVARPGTASDRPLLPSEPLPSASADLEEVSSSSTQQPYSSRRTYAPASAQVETEQLTQPALRSQLEPALSTDQPVADTQMGQQIEQPFSPLELAALPALNQSEMFPLPPTPSDHLLLGTDLESLTASADDPASSPFQFSAFLHQGPEDESPMGDAVGEPSDFDPPSLSEGQSLGQEPVDNTMQFLRQTTVLLRPRDWQLDVGIDYSVFETDYTVIDNGNPIETQIRSRVIETPLTLRYGLTRRAQAFLTVPVGWVSTEVSQFGADSVDNNTGLGDIRGGVTVLLRKSCCGYDPDVIATFGFTAPTGKQSYLSALFGSTDNQMGQGFWATSWNVTFIQTYDPVVIFYGFGGRYRFSREFENRHIHPGMEHFYQLGVGFAINEMVTLSAALRGSYVTEPELDGVRIAGLTREPISMRFAATISNPCRRALVEPFAEIGMTDSAASSRIGITWTY